MTDQFFTYISQFNDILKEYSLQEQESLDNLVARKISNLKQTIEGRISDNPPQVDLDDIRTKLNFLNYLNGPQRIVQQRLDEIVNHLEQYSKVQKHKASNLLTFLEQLFDQFVTNLQSYFEIFTLPIQFPDVSGKLADLNRQLKPYLHSTEEKKLTNITLTKSSYIPLPHYVVEHDDLFNPITPAVKKIIQIDSTKFISGGWDGQLLFFELSPKGQYNLLKQIQAHLGPIEQLEFDSSGLLISRDHFGLIKLWVLPDFTEIAQTFIDHDHQPISHLKIEQTLFYHFQDSSLIKIDLNDLTKKYKYSIGQQTLLKSAMIQQDQFLHIVTQDEKQTFKIIIFDRRVDQVFKELSLPHVIKQEGSRLTIEKQDGNIMYHLYSRKKLYQFDQTNSKKTKYQTGFVDYFEMNISRGQSVEINDNLLYLSDGQNYQVDLDVINGCVFTDSLLMLYGCAQEPLLVFKIENKSQESYDKDLQNPHSLNQQQNSQYESKTNQITQQEPDEEQQGTQQILDNQNQQESDLIVIKETLNSVIQTISDQNSLQEA